MTFEEAIEIIEEVDEVFNEWYSNELDYLGIEGNWEEVSDD